jgi:hypothetical protein
LISELKTLYLQQHRQRYPSLPEPARVAPKYSDKSANGLQKCIIDYIRLTGGHAERISCTGRYIPHKIVSDVLGHKRRIGTAKWIYSSMQKGTSDISATINGRSVKIEVKMPGDKQSKAQAEYERQVEQAGGIYLIVHSFDEFMNWYNDFLKF